MQVFVTPPPRMVEAIYGIDHDEWLDGIVDVRVAGVARRQTHSIKEFITLCSKRVICRAAIAKGR